MIKPVLTQLTSRCLSLLFALFLVANSLHSQITYSCRYDDTLPAGTAEFTISIMSSPGEVWTLENVANLYTNINPDILIDDGFVIPEDAMTPGLYEITGFAYDGVMPFATVVNNDIPVIDMNMVTCMAPTVTLTGDMDVCLGETATIMASVSNPDVDGASVMWSTTGSVASSNVSGINNLIYEVEFDELGSHLVMVEGMTDNGFPFSANVVVNVFDFAEDFVISGNTYLCPANNDAVPFSVNLPSDVTVTWSAVPGVNSITPLNASGSLVEVDFPDAPGIYTLSIANADADGCTIAGIIRPVEVTDVIDTVSIDGDNFVCLNDIADYSVDPAYTNVGWVVTPNDPPGMGGFEMTPMSGSGSSITVEYTLEGSYDIMVSGMTPDGCDFASMTTVNVPGDDVESIACNNSVNVSLNNNCILELQADMILEGEFDQNDAYILTIQDAQTGEVLQDNMVTQDQLGHTFIVTVTQECGGNSCWGTLVVEDKSITELEPFCPTSVSVTCYDYADPSMPVGYPDFGPGSVSVYRPDKNDWIVSGFDNCSDAILSFEDLNTSLDECTDPQTIIRTWTAVDINNGLTSSCQVEVLVGLVDKSSIIWPPSWDSALDMDPVGGMDTDNTYPSLDACDINNPVELFCTSWLDNLDENGNPSPECTGYPEGLLCTNLQLGGYKDQVIPICGNAKKILRKWTVWDACGNETVQYTQIITIMDVSDPICIPPADKIYYTDTHECGSDVIIDPPTITNECAGWTYTIKYKTGNFDDGLPENFITDNLIFDPSTNRYTINNLSFEYDSLWVQYIVTDVCGNRTDDCFGEFELLDDEQPIPACDLNTSIALNNDGIAYAGPGTFDDSSWDNCGVYTKVIQRMQTDRCDCYERKLDFMIKLGEYEGHYYYLSRDKFNGRQAHAFADALDGYLAVIDSDEENTWLRERANEFTLDPYYIDLRGEEFFTLDWTIEGNTFNYNGLWDTNEPFPDVHYRKGDVFTVVNEDGTWEAERQTGLYTYFIIEFDTRCGWTQKENFCCADLGEETMVAMKVIDWEGNNNFCMVNVEVQDFTAPKIICPDRRFISCTTPFDLEDLSEYGEATAEDDCEVTITEDATHAEDVCGRGQIIRTFTATDGYNNSTCVQIIEIQNLAVFEYDSIYWPADTIVRDICTLEDWDPGTHVPYWNEDAYPCSQIVYTYDDLLFKIVEGACEKLIRTWTVVDWCNSSVLYTYDQSIKLINEVGPTITPESCAPVDVPEGEIVGPCMIQVDDITADVVAGTNTCSDNLTWWYSIDYKSDGDIDVNGSGNDASGTYPYGVHRLTWYVSDECGNVSSCIKTITVTDNKPPTPYCHGEIVLPINTEEGVDIWASDLDIGSQDDCPEDDVVLSFEENNLVTSVNFDCDDIPDSLVSATVYVDLWVWDDPNPSIANKSYCTVRIQLQDNAGVCGAGMGRIAGNITDPSYDMIENVELSIMASNPGYPQNMMVSEGEYAFEDIPMYQDYTIEASKDDDYLNGVSTLDLLMIQRHILGIEQLDSPYELIAADINSSEDISAIDLIELRKLILGVYQELPNNDSWRFIKEGANFVDPLSPWPLPEVINVNDLDTNVSDANFMGIKIGDINGSAIANHNNNGKIATSSINIAVEQTITDKGNTRIQLIATSDQQLAGTQFALSFDPFETDIIAAIPMAMNVAQENIGWEQVDNGVIPLSWNTNTHIAVSEGDVLVEFLFSGTHQQNILHQLSHGLDAEIYTETLDGDILTQELNLVNVNAEADQRFDLSQNIPNPFNENTVIGFNLPESNTVTLTITDLSGRLVLKQQGVFPAGYSEIAVNQNQLNTTGILYYTISTATHSSTKKMVVVK